MNSFDTSNPIGGANLRPDVVALGGAAVDIHAEPDGERTGNKHPARVRIVPGGNPTHAARTTAANGLRATVVASQGHGWVSDLYCRQAAAEGFGVLLQKRPDPAISVIVPNGSPGKKDIYVQRAEPPTAGELTPEMTKELGLARVVFVGPLPAGPRTWNLLDRLPALAGQAFRAWMPHPTQVADPTFTRVARQFQYVQLNSEEARRMDGATEDHILNACRLRFLCGSENACAVTNGAGRGYLWGDGRWLSIDPKLVDTVDEVGCGDAFGSALVIGWRLLGLSLDAALNYAVDAAATAAGQVGLTAPLAYRMVS